jgi:hypothetical protein
MSDISQRLRRASGFALMSAARETLREAADEIDRLRCELDKAAEVVAACVEDHGKMRMLCANGKYLTDAESHAVTLARAALIGRGCTITAETLQGILDRLSKHVAEDASQRG